MKAKIKLFFKRLFLVVVLIGVNVSAFYAGAFTKNCQWKKELIQRELAEFNVKTGEWQYAPVGSLFGDALPVSDSKLAKK